MSDQTGFHDLYGHRFINTRCRLCANPKRIYNTVSGLNRHTVSTHQHYHRANGMYVPISTEDLEAARGRDHPGRRQGNRPRASPCDRNRHSPPVMWRAMRVQDATPDLREHLQSRRNSRRPRPLSKSPERHHQSPPSSRRRLSPSPEARSSPGRHHVVGRLSSTVSVVADRRSTGDTTISYATFSPLCSRRSVVDRPSRRRRQLRQYGPMVRSSRSSTLATSRPSSRHRWQTSLVVGLCPPGPKIAASRSTQRAR